MRMVMLGRTTTAVLVIATLLIALRPLGARNVVNSPCAMIGDPTQLPGIAEASGLTVSRRVPGLLWSFNDSGKAVVFGVDGSGVRAAVRIPNATVTDWEDISAGHCPSGDCLYIADIGDNKQIRSSVTIYRVAEPGSTATHTSAPDVFTAAYPDGPHDAEALFVIDAGLFIITKDEVGALYRLPQPLNSTSTMMLQQVGTLGLHHVTDADASPDGRLVAVRTHNDVVFYRAADLASGGPVPRGAQTSLRALHEPQGEGVTLDGDGDVYLVSEGAGRAGRLTSLRCTLK